MISLLAPVLPVLPVPGVAPPAVVEAPAGVEAATVVDPVLSLPLSSLLQAAKANPAISNAPSARPRRRPDVIGLFRLTSLPTLVGAVAHPWRQRSER